MGEMKIEHVLLFLVGAFLVYHMMKGCGCNKVEGMRVNNKHWWQRYRPNKVGKDCLSTTYGCCPRGKRAAKSDVDECLPHVVDFDGMSTPEARDACPKHAWGGEKAPWSTPECYFDGQRCIYDPACLDPLDPNFKGGQGCIVKDGDQPGHEDDHRTACRICGVEGYPPCPKGAKHPHKFKKS